MNPIAYENVTLAQVKKVINGAPDMTTPLDGVIETTRYLARLIQEGCDLELITADCEILKADCDKLRESISANQ